MAVVSSALIGDQDRFAEYKYEITEFYIITNGITDEFPVERISDFKIENHFEEADFPILKLTVLMESSRYYSMMKNKNNVKFKLRIQSYYTINGDNKGEKSLYRDVINDTFSFFPDDDNNDYEKELKDEAGTSDDRNELDALSNYIELFLFKDSFVTGLRSSYNNILNNCTMSTAVAYLLYMAGVKNVLMSPFENQKVYGSIVLPPISIVKIIRYLNNNFGFHKQGTIVYFGLFHSYILNCKAECTAYAPKEWKETVIYVFEKNNRHSALSSAILKPNEEKYYYSVQTDGIDISSKTVSSNVITGTDAITIDMKAGTTTKKSSNAKTLGKSNSAVLFNNSSNPYMEETFTAQMHANSTIVSLVLENVSIEAFNPNKVFSLIFESPTLNEKYKGTYRIASSIFSFTNNGACYVVTATVVLKKVS